MAIAWLLLPEAFVPCMHAYIHAGALVSARTVLSCSLQCGVYSTSSRPSLLCELSKHWVFCVTGVPLVDMRRTLLIMANLLAAFPVVQQNSVVILCAASVQPSWLVVLLWELQHGCSMEPSACMAVLSCTLVV